MNRKPILIYPIVATLMTGSLYSVLHWVLRMPTKLTVVTTLSIFPVVAVLCLWLMLSEM
jgi:hypothetical protein